MSTRASRARPRPRRDRRPFLITLPSRVRRLKRRPFDTVAFAHLSGMLLLPALLQMEYGGFQRSGGVLAWSSVSPFTAMLLYNDNVRVQAVTFAGFVFMCAACFLHESLNRAYGEDGAAIAGDHVVKVWLWQIYVYAIATVIGVTLNACVLMHLCISKSTNAIEAHKALACAIMPPPVAKEVFEVQWKRLKEGKKMQKQESRTWKNAPASGAKKKNVFARVINAIVAITFGSSGSGSGGGSSASESRSRSRQSSKRSGMGLSSIGGGGGGARSDDFCDDSTHGGRAPSERSEGDLDSDTASASDGNSMRGGDTYLRAIQTTQALRAPSEDTIALRDRDLDVFFEGAPDDAGADAAGEDVSSQNQIEKPRRRSSILYGKPGVSGGGGGDGDGAAANSLRRQSTFRKRRGASVKAREHKDVTVIFCDIVDFSAMCKVVKPYRVLRFLETYFQMLDDVAEEHGVTKVRTVGDGYLAVSGLMAEMGVKEDARQHRLRALHFAAGVLTYMKDERVYMPNGVEVKIRIGLAAGSVYSGVVGRTCMQFDIYGDVANLAARMEQTCRYDGVHFPRAMYDAMKGELSEEQGRTFDALKWEFRDGVEIKGMDAIDTVSLVRDGNEEAIELELMGGMSNDQQRAVTTHIGVLAEAFRQKSWTTTRKRSVDDERSEDGSENSKEDEPEKPKKPPTQRQVSFLVGNVPSLARPWELPPAED